MNFSTLDLNLLRVLDALLETRSTVDAGRRIGLSQPAVSAALKRLRENLEDPILVREGRKLVRTDFGEAIATPLRRKLEELEALLAAATSFDPAEHDASFHISGSDYFAEMLMPELNERVSKRAPRIRLHLVDLTADLDLSVLDRRLSDIALLPRIPYPDWIRSTPVFRSGMIVIARQGHPEIAKAGLRPEETLPLDLYCAQSHVSFSPEGRATTLYDETLEREGRSRRIALTLPVFGGIGRAVARSDMLALISDAFARRIAPNLGLALYNPPLPVEPVQLDMVWHVRSDTHPAHRWLRNQIVELMEALATEDQRA